MNEEFISIIKRVISDRGKNVVNNIRVFNSLLADYAKGQYTRERMQFIRELKTSSFDELMRKYQPPSPPPAPTSARPPSRSPGNNPRALMDDDEDDDYFDDEDDEDDEVYNQPVSRNRGGGYFIKCPHCGEVGEITDKRDIRSRHLGYICPRCGENFTIEFFGVCRSCREKTGFNAHRLSTVLLAAGTAFLDALEDKPKGFFSSIGDAIKESHPYGSAAGECTFCKQIHIECPRCHSAVKFPHDKRIDKDVVRCPECGQWMRHP